MKDADQYQRPIHDLIYEAAVEFEIRTGKSPRNIYLGEMEMRTLREWAKENAYIKSKDVDLRGQLRPEIHGMLVYSVNDVSHLKCS